MRAFFLPGTVLAIRPRAAFVHLKKVDMQKSFKKGDTVFMHLHTKEHGDMILSGVILGSDPANRGHYVLFSGDNLPVWVNDRRYSIPKTELFISAREAGNNIIPKLHVMSKTLQQETEEKIMTLQLRERAIMKLMGC